MIGSGPFLTQKKLVSAMDAYAVKAIVSRKSAEVTIKLKSPCKNYGGQRHALN